jgi:hypothetical protein
MCRKWSFVDFPILVEMLDFFKGIHPGVVSEHCEQGAGYAPLRPITHRRFSQVIGCLCALVVGNFVVASMDITSSQIFESLAGLDQKTTSRQFYSSLLPVTSPNGKARILALAMDGEEADVTVEASKHCTQVVFLKVASSRREKVRSTIEHIRESRRRQPHTDRGHFSNDSYGVKHLMPKCFHVVFPLRIVIRHYLWEVVR